VEQLLGHKWAEEVEYHEEHHGDDDLAQVIAGTSVDP
jgi:hypothetical protein